MKYRHPRFLKSFSQHLPYGNRSLYEKWVMRASLEKLSQLVKICGFLMQTKRVPNGHLVMKHLRLA